MLASNVQLNNLKTCEECRNAYDEVNGDFRNYLGGLRAWNSGYASSMTVTAENKLKAIDARYNRLFKKLIKEQYKVYAKKYGAEAVSFEEYNEQELFA